MTFQRRYAQDGGTARLIATRVGAHFERLHVELPHVVQAHVQAAVLGRQPVQRALKAQESRSTSHSRKRHIR